MREKLVLVISEVMSVKTEWSILQFHQPFNPRDRFVETLFDVVREDHPTEWMDEQIGNKRS